MPVTLTSLRIRNLALSEELAWQLAPGFRLRSVVRGLRFADNGIQSEIAALLADLAPFARRAHSDPDAQ